MNSHQIQPIFKRSWLVILFFQNILNILSYTCNKILLCWRLYHKSIHSKIFTFFLFFFSYQGSITNNFHIGIIPCAYQLLDFKWCFVSIFNRHQTIHDNYINFIFWVNGFFIFLFKNFNRIHSISHLEKIKTDFWELLL